MEDTAGRSGKVSEIPEISLGSQTGSEGLANMLKGAVTDYGSSMIQWMRNRQPRYKGAPKVEMERPSASYIADVCDPRWRLCYIQVLWSDLMEYDRCSHP